jgi:hypothetical protein
MANEKKYDIVLRKRGDAVPHHRWGVMYETPQQALYDFLTRNNGSFAKQYDALAWFEPTPGIRHDADHIAHVIYPQCVKRGHLVVDNQIVGWAGEEGTITAQDTGTRVPVKKKGTPWVEELKMLQSVEPDAAMDVVRLMCGGHRKEGE